MPSVNVPGVGRVNFPDTMSQKDIIAAIERDIIPSINQPPAPTKAPTAPTTLRDIGVAGASGFVGATKSLTDVFGADNAASQALSRASTGLQEMYTPERQREMQYYQAKQQEAAKRGDITGEVGAALEGIKAAPLQGTVQAIGSLVPNLATLLIPGAGEARALQLSRGAINTAIGIMQGTGAVKGAIYEGVKQELIKSGVDEATAAQKAAEAQSYLGKNADQILAGAVIGFGVGRYGAEQLLSPGVGGATRKLAAIGTEMGTEAIQGGQEQLAQNIALQRQGFDVPTFQGVAGAATQEGVLGALGAGSVSLVSGRPSKKDVPEAPPVDEKQIQLLLAGEGPFTPVGLPDGSVAVTRADLDAYLKDKREREANAVKRPELLDIIDKINARVGAPPTPVPTDAGLSYGTATQEIELLKRQPRTSETDSRIKDLQQYRMETLMDQFTGATPASDEQAENKILLKEIRKQMERGDMTYEGQQRAIDQLLAEFYSSRKGFKGVEKETLPKTEDEQELADLTKSARDLSTEYKAVTAKKLNTELKRKLAGKLFAEEVVSEIGVEKEYKYLAAPKGARGKLIADLVYDGALDEFLPFNMRPEAASYDGQESEEYIKNLLRTEQFRPYEAQFQARILGDQLGEIDNRIKELTEFPKRLAELSPEEVQEETDRLAREAGYLGQPRGEEVLQPPEPAAEPVVDQVALPAETQAAPEEVAASPVAQYTDANNYLQQLSQMYGQLQQQIQATPDEAPIKQELAVRADQIAQAAFATQRTRDAAASLLSDQQRVDVGLPPVGGAVATTQQAPSAPEQLTGPQPSTALSAAETDIIEGQAREVREPGAPPAIGARQPGTAVSARETDIIEGQTRFIDEETIAPAVLQLAAPEQQVLADHYGEEVNSPAFLQKLRDDIATFAIRGAKYVDRAIRDIIRKIHAAVLSAAVILNPAYLGPAYQVAVPQNVTTVEQVLAKVPEAVRAQMSPGAQMAYANILPVIQAEITKNDKLFIITDKPNARFFVFDSSGQPILDEKVLLALKIGDYYKGNTDIKANRLTPGGLFTMGLVDAKKGITEKRGNETKTAGDYDFGKVFVLDKAAPDGSYSITLFHSVYTKMSDAQARLKALDKEGAEDSRYSFGCINVKKATYKFLLDNYEKQMDGAKMFIVPDNPDATMDFLRGKAINAGDVSRQYVPEVTKKVTKTVPGTPSTSATKTQMAARKEDEQETRKGLYQVAGRNEKGMTKAAVDKAVDDIKTTWKNAPDIEVVQSMDKLPQELQDQAKADKVNPRGMYDPDTKKVWLVADNISSDAQAAITLAHESLGHFGLRVVLGTNFKPMMNQIYEGNKNVRDRADAYMEEGLDRETAVEEVLSEMAQEVYDTRVPENKNKLTALQKVMNVVRQFLARIGIPMKSISDAQILMLIANARRSVVKGGQFVDMGGGKALYSAGMSSNFKKWFKDSKVVDEDGKPMAVYHGTPRDFEEFKEKNTWEGFGFHFGTAKAASEVLRQGRNSTEFGDQRVMPVYLSIQNPLKFDQSYDRGRHDPMDIYQMVMRKAELEGISGIEDSEIDDFYQDDHQFNGQRFIDLEGKELRNLLRKWLKSIGYDGIEYINGGEDVGSTSWIAFEPTQVKSVFNKGDFSPTDARILYSKQRSKAPDWVPQSIWDLHEKLRRADAEASGDIDLRENKQGKVPSPGDLKRNQTMFFRRLNKAVEDYVGNDWQKVNDLMVRMNEESGRREKTAEDGGKAVYSEGMPSNLRKWFGDSKIVNEDGTPMVVYHGTTADISEFKVGKEGGALGNGIYMTPATEYAGGYADKKGGNVMPLYASIKNPLVIDGSVARDPMIEALVKLGVDRAKAEKIVEKAYDDKGYITNEVRSRAVAQGYDGITQFKDGKLSEIVAFNPTQVKSVFNKGEFSPTNKKVLYSAKDRIERVAQRMSSKRPEMEREAFSHVSPDLLDKADPIFYAKSETIVDRIKGLQDRFFQRLAQGVADQYRTIKEYGEKGKLAYVLARMSKTIDGALEGILFSGHVTLTDGALDIKPNTKGLYEILEPVGKEVDSYQIWVALNREAELVKDKYNVFDKDKNLVGQFKTMSEAQAAVPKDGKIEVKEGAEISINPDLVARRQEFSSGMLNGKPRIDVYRSVQKEMNALNKSVLDVPYQQGLIDKAAYDIFAKDINYIPFYRLMEDGDLQGASTAAGLGRQEFSKQLKGGEKQFGDLMENTLRNWSHILSAAMKNKAANATVEAAMDMGAAYPNLKVQYDWIDGKVYNSNTGKLVGDGSLKAEYTTQKTGMIKTMMDGKPAYFDILDPLLIESISAMGYMGPKSKFVNVAQDFKNMLQFGVTLAPAFKSRNLFRDTYASMAVSGLKLSPVSNVYRGWLNSDRKSPAYISALAGGAVFNFGSAYEGNQSKMVKRLLKQGVNPDSILDNENKLKAGVLYAWNKYQEWGNKSEAANRMALYTQLRAEGKNHLEASFQARDLLDFSMQGSWPAFRFLTQTVPFLNARVQGLYKLGRDGVIPTSRMVYSTITGNPLWDVDEKTGNLTEKGRQQKLTDKQKAQQFSVVTGSAVLASIALYLLFKDDDEFQKREAWDRDNFWWFKLPGMDNALRIPKPFEIGAFGTIAERVLEQIIDEGAEGKQLEESLRRMIGDTFAVNHPQFYRPLLDIYANKDSFTGAPIESAGMERLSKQERASDTTSPLAKALGGISNVFASVAGEKTELSPAQIDYAIKAYFGWLGGTIAFTSHYAVMPFSKSAYPDHNWTETMSMGFIKSLPATQSRYVTEFYQNSKEISQAYADMRHYAELGESDKVNQILEEKGDKIALSKSYDKAAKDMAKVRQVISSIRADETMSGSEKKEEIDRLKLLIDEIAKQMEDVRRDLRS